MRKMSPIVPRVLIHDLHKILDEASQQADLLGQDDICITLTRNQWKAFKQSLLKSAGVYKDMHGKLVPTIRFINIGPGEA